jgi:hypothetical protein
VRDNLFIVLEDKNRVNVIGCLNIQTRKWNMLDFSSRLEIRDISVSEDGNLIVHANSSKKITFIRFHLGR